MGQVVTDVYGAKIAAPTVSNEGDAFFVDFPPQFLRVANPGATGTGSDFIHAALFTAYSNSAVGSVSFSVAGDCMAFAVATGGDACATMSMNELEGK